MGSTSPLSAGPAGSREVPCLGPAGAGPPGRQGGGAGGWEGYVLLTWSCWWPSSWQRQHLLTTEEGPGEGRPRFSWLPFPSSRALPCSLPTERPGPSSAEKISQVRLNPRSTGWEDSPVGLGSRVRLIEEVIG